MQPEDQYSARLDLARSIDACYAAIRERVAQGGKPWQPPLAEPQAPRRIPMTSTCLRVADVAVQLHDEGDAIVRMTNNGKEWEPATRNRMGELLRPDAVMIDIGAYTGIYAIAAALRGAKVIAFEPHPANFKRMCKNATINSVYFNMIKAAASLNSGRMTLNMKRPINVICDTASLEARDEMEHLEVQTVPIDDLDIQREISLIKIDVEGHELKVLLGAEHTISKHRPRLLVEVLTSQAHEQVGAWLRLFEYKAMGVFDNRNVLYVSKH